MDGNEEGRAETDVGVIWDDREFLAGMGQEFHRLAYGGAAIDLYSIGARPNNPIAMHRGDDGLVRKALPEMNDAVVVTDHLYVAIIVRVVKGQQFPERIGPQGIEFPTEQLLPAPRD